MKAKINFITLAVSDLAESKTFYQKAFNFPVSEENDILCLFELADNFYLVLERREEFLNQTDNQVQGVPSAGFILSHNAESKEQVEEIIKKAVGAGARRVKTLDEAWGYSVSITDPDGHHWEIVYTTKG